MMCGSVLLVRVRVTVNLFILLDQNGGQGSLLYTAVRLKPHHLSLAAKHHYLSLATNQALLASPRHSNRNRARAPRTPRASFDRTLNSDEHHGSVAA